MSWFTSRPQKTASTASAIAATSVRSGTRPRLALGAVVNTHIRMATKLIAGTITATEAMATGKLSPIGPVTAQTVALLAANPVSATKAKR